MEHLGSPPVSADAVALRYGYFGLHRRNSRFYGFFKREFCRFEGGKRSGAVGDAPEVVVNRLDVYNI
ncbi:hypothetical protein [Novosphingobium terrae]|uniref:hypothetical protein n=1 Tax=Novosphingobium terrae TaxID=2726189 RepID=UPI00197D2511|nr:hypothetical protein [Novosphingobium terrae]